MSLVRARDRHLHSQLTARSTAFGWEKNERNISFCSCNVNAHTHIWKHTAYFIHPSHLWCHFHWCCDAPKCDAFAYNFVHLCVQIFQLRIWNAIKWFYRVLYVLHSTHQKSVCVYVCEPCASLEDQSRLIWPNKKNHKLFFHFLKWI